MNYEDKLNEILKENMTENGFNLWKAINSKVPSPWNKPSSSSGKYHVKKNNYVPNIAEHTLEMINSAVSIYPMFNISKNSIDLDLLLFGIAMHDIVKYGNNNDMKHTTKLHDKLIADRIENRKEIFLKLFNEDQIKILTDMVRYHSGRWSTDAKNDFDFKNFHPYVLFVHMLDMLSTKNCLLIGDENGTK